MLLVSTFGLVVSAVTALGQLDYEPYAFRTLADTDDGLYQPVGVVVDSAGNVFALHNVFVYEDASAYILKITPSGSVTLFAGGKVQGYRDGRGTDAQFHDPSGIAIDRDDNIYVADHRNFCVRKITPDGVVTTFAGEPGVPRKYGECGEPQRFGFIGGIATDRSGNVYVTDGGIRKITPSGAVSTIVSSEKKRGGDPVDGCYTKEDTVVFSPDAGLGVDSQGNIYVGSSCRINKITPAGAVSILAGSDVQCQSFSEGNVDGSGTQARFELIRGVAVDSEDNVFVTDVHNLTIRKITPAGQVTTIGGSPNVAGREDGSGSLARFTYPMGVTVDSSDRVYVADMEGTNGIRVGTSTVPSARIAVSLEAPPGSPLVWDNVYRIGIEPKMPTIVAHARVTGIVPDPTGITEFTWRFAVRYESPPIITGYDKSQTPAKPIFGTRTFEYEWPGPQGVPTLPWTSFGGRFVTRFDDPAFAGDIFGGDLFVTATAVINGRVVTSRPLTGYRILGPPMSSLEAEASKPLMAKMLGNSTMRKIANHESSASQFDVNGFPLWSGDKLGGVGVMQLTKPAPKPEVVWNWEKNIHAAIELFQSDGKLGAARKLRARAEKHANLQYNMRRVTPDALQFGPPQPIRITVRDLTPRARSNTPFNEQFDGVRFSDSEDQFQQVAIRIYNGVAGKDVFTPGAGLHEFQLRRDASGNLLFVEDAETIARTKSATATWQRVTKADRDAQYPPIVNGKSQYPGDANYVRNVLEKADLPQ